MGNKKLRKEAKQKAKKKKGQQTKKNKYKNKSFQKKLVKKLAKTLDKQSAKELIQDYYTVTKWSDLQISGADRQAKWEQIGIMWRQHAAAYDSNYEYAKKLDPEKSIKDAAAKKEQIKELQEQILSKYECFDDLELRADIAYHLFFKPINGR